MWASTVSAPKDSGGPLRSIAWASAIHSPWCWSSPQECVSVGASSATDGGCFASQEKLILLFLGIIWLLVLIGPATVGRYSVSVDHPSMKLDEGCRVSVYAFSRGDEYKKYQPTDVGPHFRRGGARYSGLGNSLSSVFQRSFKRVGGPDFAEANFFAAYMATMLWIIAGQFLRSDMDEANLFVPWRARSRPTLSYSPAVVVRWWD